MRSSEGLCTSHTSIPTYSVLRLLLCLVFLVVMRLCHLPFVSYLFRGEANGQFIPHRCGKCKSQKEKCPLSSAIVHPFAIFIPSDTHNAPAEITNETLSPMA